MNGLSKDEDYSKLLEYQWKYAKEIEPFKGWFDFNDSNVQNFLKSNKIHCDTFGPKKLSTVSQKNDPYLLFSQNSRCSKSGTDVAHHLLRHIRNAVGHGNIEKIIEEKDGKSIEILILRDFYQDSGNQNMECRIESSLFYQLLDLLIKTKK